MASIRTSSLVRCRPCGPWPPPIRRSRRASPGQRRRVVVCFRNPSGSRSSPRQAISYETRSKMRGGGPAVVRGEHGSRLAEPTASCAVARRHAAARAPGRRSCDSAGRRRPRPCESHVTQVAASGAPPETIEPYRGWSTDDWQAASERLQSPRLARLGRETHGRRMCGARPRRSRHRPPRFRTPREARSPQGSSG
jgi:hypothetical protein